MHTIQLDVKVDGLAHTLSVVLDALMAEVAVQEPSDWWRGREKDVEAILFALRMMIAFAKDREL